MKKNFFKTEAFRCIVVLFVITVVMCTILAILNDVLYVSSEERLNRAVKKVYGKSVTAQAQEIDESRVATDFGSIDEYYSFTDEGVYYELFKSTGIKGYKDGSVTLWVLVKYENNKPVSLANVTVDSYEKQTLMSSFTSSFFKTYTSITPEELESGKLFKTGNSKYDNAMLDNTDIKNVVSGATKSSNAMNNAVNTVLLYLWGEAV